MYCIISLPRSASTYSWYLINQSLSILNPAYVKGESVSAFNPRYLTAEQIEVKYKKIINSSPLPLIKIVSNHDFSMVDRIIQSQYKTVFIYPADLRKQVLKVLVAKKTDSFVNKDVRTQYLGTLMITKDEILERLEYYKRHMLYADKCDYVFSDKFILNNPSEFVSSLGLEYMGTKYKYKPYEISDEEMVQDISAFYQLYEEVYEEAFK